MNNQQSIGFKGVIRMEDGAGATTSVYQTELAVKAELKSLILSTSRYFKRNGVDYGKKGKLFTYEEEHEGIREVKIIQIITTEYKDITKEFKRGAKYVKSYEVKAFNVANELVHHTIQAATSEEEAIIKGKQNFDESARLYKWEDSSINYRWEAIKAYGN